MDDWTENCILLHFMLGQQLVLTSNENENIPLYYHIVDNFHIQFGREEFCLLSGLKLGVENSTDYNKAKDPIPFRRRVFSSDLDGGPIRGKDVELLIVSDVFKKLDDNDAVSLCCVGILQLVLLGVEDRRPVPNWILRDANVKRWQPLYASDPTNETDMKSYSIEGFAWAFKTWILESFRAAKDNYYTRYRRHPRIIAWSLKHKFYRHMLKPMFHGQLPVERLVPDVTEARSRWWVSSRAYFDGRSFEDEQIPRHLNRNNYFEVPSEMYREFEEQRRGYQEMILDYQGVPSSFHTLPNNISFFNMAKPSNCQTPNQSNWLSPLNWQTPNSSYLGTPNSQPPIPSQPGTSNWQNPMTSYFPNLPPPIPSRCQDARILDPNLCDRARREPQPSVYMLSSYTVLPPTTVLTKKWIDKTKKRGKTKKLSPLNLGNTFADENVSGDDVTITVPHLCTYRRERSWPEGWLSSDHMNSWIQILIRERIENANWTLAKSGTVCLHQENNRFMILTDPHNIETLDGSVRPFPSWNDVTWVYMPINAEGVHWVTGAINLADAIFYVFDSMESETRMLMLE
ncbi:phospholipase-like protein [Tanacetum coccineum]